MKTDADGSHRFEVLAKRIVRCLGDGFDISTVVHAPHGCSVYVEMDGVLWLVGDSYGMDLEDAYRDLVEGYFIHDGGVSEALFLGAAYSDGMAGLVSHSLSELEMKLTLRGV